MGNQGVSDSTRGQERILSHPVLDLRQRLDEGSVSMVPVSSLLDSDSPRLAGEDMDHVRLLAHSEAVLPPIIVHRATMQVIDGMHRLLAAKLRGAQKIEVRFFDGDETDAFVLAVEANVTHGLALSLADRRAAASRIVKSHPQWSDRAIAVAVGLSNKTVGKIRQHPSGEFPQTDTRIGQDGRVRPVDSTAGRRRAGDLIRENPSASLRQIAKAAGISAETARDVRERLGRGEDPVPSKRQSNMKASNPRSRQQRIADQNLPLILQRLSSDPSLRSTETGRILLRLIALHAMDSTQWARLVETVPPHRAPAILHAADECAAAWRAFADQLRISLASSTQPGTR